jgi:hypothetical protein
MGEGSPRGVASIEATPAASSPKTAVGLSASNDLGGIENRFRCSAKAIKRSTSRMFGTNRDKTARLNRDTAPMTMGQAPS